VRKPRQPAASTVARRAAQEAARTALADALAVMLAAGLRVPCVGRVEWTSEDPEARALAALECAACPVWDRCHPTAEVGREQAGVWAGVDLGAGARPDTSPSGSLSVVGAGAGPASARAVNGGEGGSGVGVPAPVLVSDAAASVFRKSRKEVDGWAS